MDELNLLIARPGLTHKEVLRDCQWNVWYISTCLQIQTTRSSFFNPFLVVWLFHDVATSWSRIHRGKNYKADQCMVYFLLPCKSTKSTIDVGKHTKQIQTISYHLGFQATKQIFSLRIDSAHMTKYPTSVATGLHLSHAWNRFFSPSCWLVRITTPTILLRPIKARHLVGKMAIPFMIRTANHNFVNACGGRSATFCVQWGTKKTPGNSGDLLGVKSDCCDFQLGDQKVTTWITWWWCTWQFMSFCGMVQIIFHHFPF